jgi:hypothetical protein
VVPRAVKEALTALERVTSEAELRAALETLCNVIQTSFPPGTDPNAIMMAIFGAEAVAVVTEAGAAAVAELDAEAAASGGEISAEERITRNIVQRITKSPRPLPARAPRARRAVGARVMRASRARRGHRRAVRLSAVASAGDGPPPPSPRSRAATCPRDPARRALIIAPSMSEVRR